MGYFNHRLAHCGHLLINLQSSGFDLKLQVEIEIIGGLGELVDGGLGWSEYGAGIGMEPKSLAKLRMLCNFILHSN